MLVRAEGPLWADQLRASPLMKMESKSYAFGLR